MVACGDQEVFLQFLRLLPSLREGKRRRNCKRESCRGSARLLATEQTRFLLTFILNTDYLTSCMYSMTMLYSVTGLKTTKCFHNRVARVRGIHYFRINWKGAILCLLQPSGKS